jgi:hypothetical protein
MAHGVEVMPPKKVYESERPPRFHSLQLDEACARARIPIISALADLSVGLVVTIHTVAEVLTG